MKNRIVIYLQPWELDDFARQIDTLIKSSYFISDEVLFDITLNVSDKLVDWNLSRIPKDYFLKKFEFLIELLGQYYPVEPDTNEDIQGSLDKRRRCAKKEQDSCIWLDYDVFFTERCLPNLINASKVIPEKNYIISPQTTKMWDESWKCLENELYTNEHFDHRNIVDVYKLSYNFSDKNVELLENQHVKFGGGWFNMISDGLLKAVPFPVEMGSYGPDDTYLSLCAKKVGGKQYILKNEVAQERTPRYDRYKDYCKEFLVRKVADRQKITDQRMYDLVREFWIGT